MRFLLIFCVIMAGGCSQPPVVHDAGTRPKGVYHVVERHQTLWRICKTYDVDIDDVARVNGIKDKSKIRVGQRIFIPRATKVVKVDVYIEDLTARKGTRPVSYVKDRFIWPVRGRVMAKFGTDGQRRHDGIDISAPRDTPIRAADTGRVVYSDNKMRGYGNLIIIEHSNSFFTIYAHNKVNLVNERVRIQRGQVIGRVGSTGNAKGPHLHFEIRKGSKPLDPLRFLP